MPQVDVDKGSDLAHLEAQVPKSHALVHLFI